MINIVLVFSIGIMLLLFDKNFRRLALKPGSTQQIFLSVLLAAGLMLVLFGSAFSKLISSV